MFNIWRKHKNQNSSDASTVTDTETKTWVFNCFAEPATQLENWAKRNANLGYSTKTVEKIRNNDRFSSYYEVTLTGPVDSPIGDERHISGGITAEWGWSYPWGSVPPVYYRLPENVWQTAQKELNEVKTRFDS